MRAIASQRGRPVPSCLSPPRTRPCRNVRVIYRRQSRGNVCSVALLATLRYVDRREKRKKAKGLAARVRSSIHGRAGCCRGLFSSRSPHLSQGSSFGGRAGTFSVWSALARQQSEFGRATMISCGEPASCAYDIASRAMCSRLGRNGCLRVVRRGL